MSSSQRPSTQPGRPVPQGEGREARFADVDRKHRLVAEFLDEHRFDALLLQTPANFQWFCSGADNTRCGGPETAAALFITSQARVVVTNNIDAVELFEKELAGLGFQLKQRAWHEPHQVLLEDLCRGRTVADDTGAFGTKNVSPHLLGMRLPLTELETARLRELGRRLVHSVEATARNCRREQTEAELAGEVAHRMIKRRVVPVRIQVAGDGRAERFRHWSYGKEPVRHFGTISAIGRWHGLHLGVARTFSFGHPSPNVRDAHHKCMLMLATGMAFSKHEWELTECWKRLKRIYEKFDAPAEWQLARQAEITGYNVTEVSLVPQSDFTLAAGMPMYWHPSVGPALAGESLLVAKQGFEWMTPTERWPKLTVEVKARPIECPGILVRHQTQDDEAETTAAGDSFLGYVTDDSGSGYDLTAVMVD